MLIPPKMKTKKDCGLTAMAWAVHKILNLDYDVVYNKLKKIMEYEDVDMDDNPAEHERILEILQKHFPDIKYSLVEPIKEWLFSGKLPEDRTIMLIQFESDDENKVVKFIETLMQQHWIVLKKVDVENKIVYVWWGDGTYRAYSFEKMEKMLTVGFPNCVYVIGEFDLHISNPWYSKLYAWLVNTILTITKFKEIK